MINYRFKCHLLGIERELSEKEVFVYYLKGFFAEFLGTFCLVFFGCACVKVPPPVTAVGISFCFALVIGSTIQFIGPLTLAHLNPAVSLSFYLFGLFSLPMLFNYIVAQVAGATVGMLLLKEMFHFGKPAEAFCCTMIQPGVGLVRGFFWEFFLTMLLILLVCSVVDPRNFHKMDSIPIKFGIVIFTLVFLGLPITNTGINPARSFGPAVAFGKFKDHWVYWVAPLSSSFVTTIVYHLVFLPKDGQMGLKIAAVEAALLSVVDHHTSEL